MAMYVQIHGTLDDGTLVHSECGDCRDALNRGKRIYESVDPTSPIGSRFEPSKPTTPTTGVGEYRYGFQGFKPATVPVTSRVFVLRLNYIILGVLTNEERAIHEAKALIDAFTASGHSWVELQKDRMWRSSDGRWLEIDAHDVR